MKDTAISDSDRAPGVAAGSTTGVDFDLPTMIGDIEEEILALVRDRDPSTHGLYEMVRYHMGLDGSGSAGKRMRPLLGLLAYASSAG